MKNKLIAAAVGAAALLTGTTVLAVASIPDSNGLIHACIGPLGYVRIVNAGATSKSGCHLGETPLTWNQTGPAGPAGPAATTDLTNTQMASYRFSVPEASDDTMGVAYCPDGDVVATGGGYLIAPEDADDVDIIMSMPAASDAGTSAGFQPDGWRVDVRNKTGRPFNGRTIYVEVWAVCAPGNRRIGPITTSANSPMSG